MPIKENDFGYLNTFNYFQPHIASANLYVHYSSMKKLHLTSLKDILIQKFHFYVNLRSYNVLSKNPSIS